MAKLDLLQGTLDLLILKTLALGPQHGWGISQRIQQISENVLRVNQGSLYPALQRLETAGWIESEWGASENNRQAKFYRLTKKGERQLQDETDAVGTHDLAVQQDPRKPKREPHVETTAARSFAATSSIAGSTPKCASTSRWKPRRTSSSA